MSDHQLSRNEHFPTTVPFFSGWKSELYCAGGPESENGTSRPESRSSSVTMTTNVSNSSHLPAFRATTSRRGGRASTPSTHTMIPKSSAVGNVSMYDKTLGEEVTDPLARNDESAYLHDPQACLYFKDIPAYHDQGQVRFYHHNDPNSYQYPATSHEIQKGKPSGVKDLSRLMAPFDPLMACDSNDDANEYGPKMTKNTCHDYLANSRHEAALESFPQMKILPSFSHDEYQPKRNFHRQKDSVFRTRQDQYDQEEMDAPKILLSLGSSKTFEETKESATERNNYDDSDNSGKRESSPVKVLFASASLPFGNVSGSHLEYPSSPDEPPQIQLHSSPQALFFNRSSPISSKTHGIEAMNSFPFFSSSQSFEDGPRIMDQMNPNTYGRGILHRGKNLESLQNKSLRFTPRSDIHVNPQSQPGPPPKAPEINKLLHNNISRVIQSDHAQPKDDFDFQRRFYGSNPGFPPIQRPSIQSYHYGHGQERPIWENMRPKPTGPFLHGQILSELTFILPRLREIVKQTDSIDPDWSPALNNNAKPSLELNSPNPDFSSSNAVYVSPEKARGYNVNVSDLIIARRRVKSAVCAFGGGMRKVGSGESVEQSTVRFHESSNHLSWECEEDGAPQTRCNPLSSNDSVKTRINNTSDIDDGHQRTTHVYDDNDRMIEPATSPLRHSGYKCKMCGQPKQSHICPAIASYERSIGVMVYPTLNAFVASEPGHLSQSLSIMNNFTAGSELHSANDKTPSRLPLSEPNRMQKIPLHYVSPDVTVRNGLVSKDVCFSLDHMSSQHVSKRQKIESLIPRTGSDVQADAGSVSVQTTHLMPYEMSIQPEQFRVADVQRMKGSYEYPVIPLPYTQRKKLSDYLLSLSSFSSLLRDECASVLREGRQKGMWDLAVAELITQVIILFNCHPYDVKLDGLSMYLRSMGISC